MLGVTAHSVSLFSEGRLEGWGGGGEPREAMKACDSCRGRRGNHVVIRNVIVKEHSEPSCEMENRFLLEPLSSV